MIPKLEIEAPPPADQTGMTSTTAIASTNVNRAQSGQANGLGAGAEQLERIAAMDLDFETRRLFLRPIVETDADLGVEILTDPEVMRYVGGTRTPEQAIREMATSVKRSGGGCIGIWCVIDRATQEKLGTALLLPLPIELDDTDWSLVDGDQLPDSEIELGYLLKRSAWGKGYATEAARRLLRFAFEDAPLGEVVAVTDRENTRSQYVLEKAGMSYEGLRRAYRTQCHGFRLTREQWHAANATSS